MSADYVIKTYFCDFCQKGFDTYCTCGFTHTYFIGTGFFGHEHRDYYKPPDIPRGFFIEFIGARNSGKSVQMNMLQKRLADVNIKTEIYTFPNTRTEKGESYFKYLKNEANLDAEAAYRLFRDHRLEFDKEIRLKLSMGISIISKNYSYYSMAFTRVNENSSIAWHFELEEKWIKPDMCFLMKSNNSADGNVIGLYSLIEKIAEPKSYEQFIKNSNWYTPSNEFINPGLVDIVGPRKDLSRYNHLSIITPIDSYKKPGKFFNWLEKHFRIYLRPDYNLPPFGSFLVFNYRACCSIPLSGTDDDIHMRIVASLFFYLYNSGVWNQMISERELESVLDPVINGRSKSTQTNIEKMDQDQLSCGVCFDVSRYNVVWNCSHIFCERCSNKWLEQNAHNPTCPICRSAFTYFTKLNLNL